MSSPLPYIRLALAIATAACGAASEEQPARSAGATGAAVPVVVRAPVAADAGLDSACVLVVVLVRDTLRLVPVRDTATSFAAPREIATPWRGCRTTATNAGAAPGSIVATRVPDGVLQRAFLGHGFIEELALEVRCARDPALP